MAGFGQRLRQWMTGGAGRGYSSSDYEPLPVNDEESQFSRSSSPVSSSPTRFKRFGARTSRRKYAVLALVDLLVVVLLVLFLEPLITLLLRNDELFRPELTLLDMVPSSSNPATRPKIPRILHQTTPNATIPAKWAKSQQSCKDVYADYEYMVRMNVPRLTAGRVPSNRTMLTDLTSSYGPTRALKSFSPTNTHGLSIPGITTHFRSNAPTPFDILFSTTTAAYTSTWTRTATRRFLCTRSSSIHRRST